VCRFERVCQIAQYSTSENPKVESNYANCDNLQLKFGCLRLHTICIAHPKPRLGRRRHTAMFQGGCTHPVDLGQTERIARVREWVKKKQCSAGKKRSTGASSSSAMTRPDSDLRRFLLFPFSTVFFFSYAYTRPLPLTHAPRRSQRVKVTVFQTRWSL